MKFLMQSAGGQVDLYEYITTDFRLELVQDRLIRAVMEIIKQRSPDTWHVIQVTNDYTGEFISSLTWLPNLKRCLVINANGSQFTFETESISILSYDGKETVK